MLPEKLEHKVTFLYYVQLSGAKHPSAHAHRESSRRISPIRVRRWAAEEGSHWQLLARERWLAEGLRVSNSVWFAENHDCLHLTDRVKVAAVMASIAQLAGCPSKRSAIASFKWAV